MFKKILALTLLTLVLISSMCFASVDRYSVTIKGFDVHRDDGTPNGIWHRMVSVTQNSIDLVNEINHADQSHWFGTKTLVDGHYDKIRIVLGKNVLYRGHWTDSNSRTYYTNPMAHENGKYYVVDQDNPESNMTVSYDIQAHDIASASGFATNGTVSFVGSTVTDGNGHTLYNPDDIAIVFNQSFDLRDGVPSQIGVTFHVDDTMAVDGSSFTFQPGQPVPYIPDSGTCTFKFYLPKINVTFATTQA